MPFSYFPFQKHNNPAWIRLLKIDNKLYRDTDNSSLSLFIFGSMPWDSISILYYPILPVSAPWFTPFNLFFLCFLFNTYLWGVDDRYLSITLVHLFNQDKYIIRVCANSESMCSQIVFLYFWSNMTVAVYSFPSPSLLPPYTAFNVDP